MIYRVHKTLDLTSQITKPVGYISLCRNYIDINYICKQLQLNNLSFNCDSKKNLMIKNHRSVYAKFSFSLINNKTGILYFSFYPLEKLQNKLQSKNPFDGLLKYAENFSTSVQNQTYSFSDIQNSIAFGRAAGVYVTQERLTIPAVPAHNNDIVGAFPPVINRNDEDI